MRFLIMNERERIIRLWFDMWLKQQDLGIDDIHGEKSLFGTLSSFSIKVIRLSWNGTSKMK